MVSTGATHSFFATSALQEFVDGEVNTIELQNLTPMTEYIIRVIGVIGEDSGEPLKGAETTREYLKLALISRLAYG